MEKDNTFDYQMGHRPTETGATVDNITLNGDVMPNDFYTHPHYYSDMNDQSYKESYKAILSVKDNPNAEIEIYRAGVNGELNNGDWVTLSKTYAVEHSKSEFGDNAQVNKYTVNVSNVQFAGDDINEFGFFADEKTVEKANETLEVIHSITVLNKSNIAEYASENQIEQLSELIERIGDNSLTIKYDSAEKVAMVDIEDQVSFDLAKDGTATFFTLDDTPTTTNKKELLDLIEDQGITLESKSINSEVNAMSNVFQIDNLKDENNIPVIDSFYDDKNSVKVGHDELNVSGTIVSVVNVQDIDNIENKDYAIVFTDNNGDEKILGGYAVSQKLNEMIDNNEIDQLKAGETFSINFSNNEIESFNLESMSQSKDIENDLFAQKQEEFLNNYTSNDELSKIVIEQGGGFEHFESNAIDISNHGAGGGFNGWVDSYQMSEWVENNHDTILTVLKNDCDEFGIESVQELLDPSGKKFSDYSENEINAVIFEADKENDASLSVMTSIAYYAVEKVSNEYSMAKDEIEAKFKEPNQFDSISEFLDSSHNKTSEQNSFLQKLDSFLEKNDIQMNGLSIEEDGRKKGELNIEINNMKKDEDGNFKSDINVKINDNEVVISGGDLRLDTIVQLSSEKLDQQMNHINNLLSDELKDVYKVNIMDKEDNLVQSIKMYDKNEVDYAFNQIPSHHTAELFENNQKIGIHQDHAGEKIGASVALDIDNKVAQDLSYQWMDKAHDGKAEVTFGVTDEFTKDLNNYSKNKGNEKENKKDEGLGLG